MPNSSNTPPRETLASLQAGRAVAAMLVAFYHTGALVMPLDKYWGYDPSYHFFDFGRAGVEFFFVLSGFIIFYIHGKDLGQPSQFFPYLKKRFLRIYPIYWIILAAIIPIYFLVPSFGFPYHREAGTIISSILLVHVNGNSNTELAAAWTLYHEMMFYFLFSLAILNKRLGMAIIAGWLLASSATLVVIPQSYIIEFLFSPLHLLFGMGMLSCWIVNRTPFFSPRPIALAGVALFLAAGMEENYSRWLADMPRTVIYGLGSALILMGIVTIERQGNLKTPPALVLIGNASYATYLINFTVLSLLAKIFIYIGLREALPALASYVFLTALSILLGVLFYLWVERPVMRFVRIRFGNQGERTITKRRYTFDSRTHSNTQEVSPVN